MSEAAPGPQRVWQGDPSAACCKFWTSWLALDYLVLPLKLPRPPPTMARALAAPAASGQ